MNPIAIPEPLLVGLLLIGGLAAAGPLSALLARASWPQNAPGPALILWQSLCLAAGLCIVGSFLVIAVRPWGDNIFRALITGWEQLRAGHWLRGLGPLNLAAGAVALTIALYLLVVMVLTTVQTLHRRRTHRRTLDLISTRTADLHVLDSGRPVAYSLPGIKSRVVLSAGLLIALGDDEARAAIEHERAHLRVRHDLLLLPFGAWARALGRIPGVAQGRLAVAELAEMHADDVAARRVQPAVLAAALAAIVMAGDGSVPRDSADDHAGGGEPDAGASLSGRTDVEQTDVHRTEVEQTEVEQTEVDRADAVRDLAELQHQGSLGAVALRVRRLLDPQPLGTPARGAIYLLACALLAIPTGLLLMGWM